MGTLPERRSKRRTEGFSQSARCSLTSAAIFSLRHWTCDVACPYLFAQYMGLDGEMTPTMLDIVHDIFAAAASDDDADAELVHLESDAAAAAAYDDDTTADCDISNRNSPSVRVKQRKLRLDIKASDGSRYDV